MVRIGIITCANMTNDLACTRYAVEKVGVSQDDVTLIDVCHSLGEHELRRWKAGL
jgi:hypothetical protein